MNVIINPGTGLVSGAYARLAWKAARQMRRDIATVKPRYDDEQPVVGARIERLAKIDERGRYGFRFTLGKRRCDVEIPGLPIERVRYLGLPDQNAWHFPRLYVDGSSWLWEFALTSIREALATTTAKREGDER
jgi:hypothetical protein